MGQKNRLFIFSLTSNIEKIVTETPLKMFSKNELLILIGSLFSS